MVVCDDRSMSWRTYKPSQVTFQLMGDQACIPSRAAMPHGMGEGALLLWLQLRCKTSSVYLKDSATMMTSIGAKSAASGLRNALRVLDAAPRNMIDQSLRQMALGMTLHLLTQPPGRICQKWTKKMLLRLTARSGPNSRQAGQKQVSRG